MALTGTKQLGGFEDLVNKTGDKYTAVTQTRGSGTPITITPIRAEHIGYSTTETVKQKIDAVAASTLPATAQYRVLSTNTGTAWASNAELVLYTASASTSAIVGQTSAGRTAGSYSELNGIGTYGLSTGSNGIGVWGSTTSASGGAGVFGYCNNTTGTSMGVFGQGQYGVVGYGNSLASGSDLSCSRNNRIQFTPSVTGNAPTSGSTPVLYVEGTNLKFWNGTTSTTIV